MEFIKLALKEKLEWILFSNEPIPWKMLFFQILVVMRSIHKNVVVTQLVRPMNTLKWHLWSCCFEISIWKVTLFANCYEEINPTGNTVFIRHFVREKKASHNGCKAVPYHVKKFLSKQSKKMFEDFLEVHCFHEALRSMFTVIHIRWFETLCN